MTGEKISPLDPQKFFSGVWHGEGELVPGFLNSWIVRKEQVRLQSRPVWLTGLTWKVEESLEFSSGKVIAREMFAELIAPDRVRVTADDMPAGAEIMLHENGFTFALYYILGEFGGRRWRLRCTDDNRIGEDGIIHDRIEMFFCGLKVARMNLAVRVER